MTHNLLTLAAIIVLLLNPFRPVFAGTSDEVTTKPSVEIVTKILEAGVPAESLQRVLKFLDENEGRDQLQTIYTCKDQDPVSVKPCTESHRTPALKAIRVVRTRYAVVIDFGKPSTQQRLFLIDLLTGTVEKHLTTHGRGSGEGRWAYKFSNTKDSKQSSLGLYQTGEIYRGDHGKTLRLYGLEKSNDQAYVRDIVVHAADYAKEGFISKVNPETGKPYGRLGLSFGCPAVDPDLQTRFLELLKEGTLVDIYHPLLMEEAVSGAPVETPEPID